LADLRGQVAVQLASPLASLPLTELCGAGMSVVIVCDEAPHHGTRLAILDGVFDQLERAGVDPDKVSVLVAAQIGDGGRLGAPPDRIDDRYGNRVRVVRHDPDDVRELDDLGTFEGVPLTINFHAVEADLLIALSVIRLDDVWSDTSGAAIVTLGLGGSATVREMRTTRFFDDRIDGTSDARPLIERVAREGAHRAGLVFAIEAIEDADGRAISLKAGAPNAVNDASTETAITLREAGVASASYDVVLAGTGEHSPTGLYGISRAAIHIGLAHRSVVMRGGALILPVGRREDDGTDAREFYDALTNASDPELVILQLQGRSLGQGARRAYLLAHVMQRNHIIAAGSHPDGLARDSHFLSTRTVREAVELAENFAGPLPRALYVRDALRTLPTYGGPYFGSNPHDDAWIELSRLN
jgi:nickel-dependent lactate racemase